MDLENKLQVLAPTGLTREDIWRHLFLTKQRKNPFVEGSYTGEDFEDVKCKWEAKKLYFLDYKKDGTRPPCIDLAMALRRMQLKDPRHYMHVDGRRKTVLTVLRGMLSLMFVMHLSTMTMLLPLAQMPIHNGGTGMKIMLWDINFILN